MSLIHQLLNKQPLINTWQRRGQYIYLKTDKDINISYTTDKYFRAKSLDIQFRNFKPLPIDDKGRTQIKLSYKRHHGLSIEKTTHEEMCEVFQDKETTLTIITLKSSPVLFHLIKDFAIERGIKTIEIEHYGTIDMPDTGFAIGHTQLEIKRLKKHLKHLKETQRDFLLYQKEQLQRKSM